MYSLKGKLKAIATIFCIRNKCNFGLIGLCQQIGIRLLKKMMETNLYVFVFLILSSMDSILNIPSNHSTLSASMILYSIHFFRSHLLCPNSTHLSGLNSKSSSPIILPRYPTEIKVTFSESPQHISYSM